MASKHTEPEIPEDEEIDFQDDDDEEMMEMEGVDMMEALGSMLTTEEGETLATALVSLKDATERIAASLEMQNKILVKILSAMKPSAPAPAEAA
jgi:hypothetical protein